MVKANPLADREHVETQYRDTSRLDARVRIYQLFSQREQDFHSWIFERLRLGPGTRVLDVGAGAGHLWLENAERAAGLPLVFGDLSAGMLHTARERLAGSGVAPKFARLDAQALPFRDASFDVVVANHMLYHVPDRGRALAEIRRVLVPGGHLHTATNGWSHLCEVRELVRRFAIESALRPAVSGSGAWDLEDAAREVGECFTDVRLRSYRDALHVTDAEPLIDAVRSMATDEDEARFQALKRHVEWMIELEGFFYVATWAGLVSARRTDAPGAPSD